LWLSVSFVVAASIRLILSVFSARYLTKLIALNETNGIGGEYTRSLLTAFFCKEYLRF
jgi:hypothetical protein